MGKSLKKFKIKWLVLALAILLRFYFYLSSFKTHSLDLFFLPVTQGQDFFQIPNGAASFLKRGVFQGHEHDYADYCWVNDNVYHPFFTLIIGLPMLLFEPWTAFNLWLFLHLATDIFILLYLAKKFSKNQYLTSALVIFLVNSFSYYEIVNNQYHFLVNLSTLLLVNENYQRGDTFRGGLYFFLGLITKPIGLLWIIPLAIYRNFKTLFLGLGAYILISLPFYFLPAGRYFFNNLLSNSKSIIPNFNLVGFFRFYNINQVGVYYLEMALMVAFLGLAALRKTKLFILIFFIVCYQLFFYASTYPYHYSILGSLIPYGLLIKEINWNVTEKATIFLLCLPPPIAYWRLVKGVHLHMLEYHLFIFWSLIPLLTLLTTTYFKKVQFTIKEIKTKK